MKTYPDFITEVVSKLPEAERECAAEFMLWFDNTHASQDMIKSDEIGWRRVEHQMWSGWLAAWERNK
jgi:hypothetical protein